MKIFIFVRKGCCLCDSLKNKLAKINLSELFPNLEEFREIDIDRFDIYKDKYKKYDYEVSGIAVEKIKKSSIKNLVVTDTIDNSMKVKKAKNIEVLTISNLVGEAIKRISNSTSVSDLFK